MCISLATCGFSRLFNLLYSHMKKWYKTCPFCNKEIPEQAQKCMHCRERVDEEAKKRENRYAEIYAKQHINDPEREKQKEEFFKYIKEQQFNSSILWWIYNSLFSKIKACQPFLKEVVIARISLVIPAIAWAIIHDLSVIMLIPIWIIWLILSVWLYWREKFLNWIIFFWTWAFVICMWISVFWNT